jgi:hypothetical protein
VTQEVQPVQRGYTMPGTSGIAKAVQKAAKDTIDVSVAHTVPVDVRAARALLKNFLGHLYVQSIDTRQITDTDKIVDDYFAAVAEAQR